jgi:hypothetical protein
MYGADGKINDEIGRGARGFISFARSIANSYSKDILASSRRLNATLAFDSRGLRGKYLIRPVNYLDIIPKDGADSARSRSDNEYEERLFTNKDGIPVEPYLTAVHLYDPTVQTTRELGYRFNNHSDDMIKHIKSMLGDAFAIGENGIMATKYTK